LDIIRFDLPDEFKPEKVSYVKLNVFDKESKVPLYSKVNITDLKDQNNSRQIETDEEGKLLFILQQGEYLVTVNKENYIFYSNNLVLNETRKRNEHIDFNIALDPLQTNKLDLTHVAILNNIFFETGSSKLMEKSNTELNNLYQLQINNPNIYITIIGHTDSVGSAEDNLKLSEDRAKAVFNALLVLGADPERLNYEARGETEALESNESESGRSANRRTEFRISYLKN
jgi:outer membrane protein OmpA-like peptidoglycan-associated protein